MVDSLERRLEIFDIFDLELLKSGLSVPHINPREKWEEMPYYKYNLTDAIVKIIGGEDGFAENLYSAVNKDVLKRVYYGIKSTGKIPKQLKQVLTGWEKVYFFRGRWSIRNLDLQKPFQVIISEHIYEGLNRLHTDHYVRKSQGQYISEPKFPEADRIREDYKRIVLNEN